MTEAVIYCDIGVSCERRQQCLLRCRDARRCKLFPEGILPSVGHGCESVRWGLQLMLAWMRVYRPLIPACYLRGRA